MSTLESDIAFEAIMRRTAAIAELNSRLKPDFAAERDAAVPSRHGVVTALAIFAGLGLMSAVIFVTGYSALLSDAPAIWIHRLMALTIAQSVLIGAVAMRLLPLLEQGRSSVSILASVDSPKLPERPAAAFDKPPAPPVMPRKAIATGKLAGREFIEHDDGSIEINTLVGRRRFVSLDAAREFVGN